MSTLTARPPRLTAPAGTAANELTGSLAASTIQAPKPDASAF
jgi:hypothetical protein